MKDILRQITVVLTILATLVVNALANILPINGQNTGAISDRFQVYFVPAGYVFSIWGIIYIGLVAFAIYQALPKQRENPRLRAAGWWVSLGGLANIAWIFLWHYEHFVLTMFAMLVLLATLIVTYVRLGIGRSKTNAIETWMARVPFSIYLGWITVATVANITDVLDFVKWNTFGIAPEIWMGIVLAAVLVITALMSFTRRDVAYGLVILWALAGITVKQAPVLAVVIPTWITFGLVAIILAIAIFLPRRKASFSTPDR
ncbi:MAG TPA: tryptophan-rich sensory protein [Anaerolineales bacterium]|nr:tryptophan-rich sensory protein [Anaerolineales bacterium]